jgi:hypothetical protein
MDGYFDCYIAAFGCGIVFGILLMVRIAIYTWIDPDFATKELTSDESVGSGREGW